MADKVFELYGDIKIRGVEKLKRDLKKIGANTKQASKSMTGMGNALKGTAIVATLTLIARKLLEVGVAAKNAFRDAQEIRSKFDQVFSSMVKGANKVADEFAESFKLAGSTSRKLLGNTGDLLVGFGFTEDAALDLSLQVNTLAQDLASFQNVSTDRASNALTKAMLGETESAKMLGISISQTSKEFRTNVEELMNVRGVTLQQAKSLEILRIAYEQTEKAQGDFSRTQGSLANQEKILDQKLIELNETIGKDLAPVFSEFITIVQDAAEGFIAFDTALRDFTSIGGREGVGVVTLLGDAIGLMMGKIRPLEREMKKEMDKIAKNAEDMARRYKEAAEGVNQSNRKFLIGISGQLPGIGQKFDLFGDFSAENIFAATDRITTAHVKNLKSLKLQAKELDDMKENMDAQLDLSNDLTLTAEQRAIATENAKDLEAKINNLLGISNSKTKDNLTLVEEMHLEYVKLEQDLEDVTAYVSTLEKGTNEWRMAMEMVASLTGQIKGNLKVAQATFGDFVDEMERAAIAQERMIGPQLLFPGGTGPSRRGATQPPIVEPEGARTGPIGAIPDIPEGLFEGLDVSIQQMETMSNLGNNIASSFATLGDSASSFGEKLGASISVLSSIVGVIQTIQAISEAAQLTTVASAIASGVAIAGAYSTAAAMASIASFGGAAAAGSAGIVQTVALSKGLAAIPGFARGGEAMVPSGFAGDGGLIRVSSGERVKVTNQGNVGRDIKLLGELVGLQKANNRNTAELKGEIKRLELKVDIDGKSLVKKVTRPAENRLEKTGLNLDAL